MLLASALWRRRLGAALRAVLALVGVRAEGIPHCRAAPGAAWQAAPGVMLRNGQARRWAAMLTKVRLTVAAFTVGLPGAGRNSIWAEPEHGTVMVVGMGMVP